MSAPRNLCSGMSSAAGSEAEVEHREPPPVAHGLRKCHKPVGSKCKYCHRLDTDPNPLEASKHIQPCLPWRREFGLECNICPYFVCNAPEYCKVDKADRAMSDPPGRLVRRSMSVRVFGFRVLSLRVGFVSSTRGLRQRRANNSVDFRSRPGEKKAELLKLLDKPGEREKFNARREEYEHMKNMSGRLGTSSYELYNVFFRGLSV